eukprot:TRINITY_DN4680_c0_g2_i1.p1 TRINITY_DN4680_c0_g2~~TRINITY_DN4680_c0_g2_i1.p1  ORF type:complete len:610 (-),score=126.17 TRINITY_DN4680_c0_g2_i1:66-1895(-)
MANSCIKCGKNLPDLFVMVSPNINDTQKLTAIPHSDISRITAVYELASDPSTDIRHPCKICTQLLKDRLDLLIRENEEEAKTYEKILLEIASEDFNGEEQQQSVQQQEDEEAKLREELAKLTNEYHEVLSTLRQERENLSEKRKDFLFSSIWDPYNSLEGVVKIGDDELNEMLNKVQTHLNSKLDLEGVNVYLDSFNIRVTPEGIATINNLRMGRLPDVPVTWEEINAAWGQCVLLLFIIAKQLEYSFTKYKPVPMGSKPLIRSKLNLKIEFPLYGTNAITFQSTNPNTNTNTTTTSSTTNTTTNVNSSTANVINSTAFSSSPPVSNAIEEPPSSMGRKLSWGSAMFSAGAGMFSAGISVLTSGWSGSGAPPSLQFDNGMEFFLFCVSEVCARAMILNKNLLLPYFINKDTIGHQGQLVSIRITGNTEANWTKALRYMLANLRFILKELPTLIKLSKEQGHTRKMSAPAPLTASLFLTPNTSSSTLNTQNTLSSSLIIPSSFDTTLQTPSVFPSPSSLITNTNNSPPTNTQINTNVNTTPSQNPRPDIKKYCCKERKKTFPSGDKNSVCQSCGHVYNSATCGAPHQISSTTGEIYIYFCGSYHGKKMQK